MSKGIFIIATDTGVGKTIISAGLLYLLLKSKYRASYFKPVASGETDVDGVKMSIDAAFVKRAAGFSEDPELVTPFAFADAVAPHLAARLAGQRIDPAIIQKRLNELKDRYDIIVAEGAGGLAVPLNNAGYMQYDLIRELGFSCLLVSRAGLGTINHTLLTLGFAKNAGLTVKGIVISGAGQTLIEEDNIATIKKLSGIKAIFTLPAIAAVDTEKLQPGNLQDAFEQSIHIDDIVALMETI
ncbi:MAG: dethiobiotin synthase [Deltaproteobacteria bacterium]|nr:dethiobiotin synthase [Deltaproteobacteria bacterium]